MPINTLPAYRIGIRLGLIWLVFLLLMTAYWLRLDSIHKDQLLEAEEHAQLRAKQAAHALSLQMHALLLNIDFVLEHLAEHWLDHDEKVFRKLIDLAQKGVFKGSLDLIAVTDANGNVLFNNQQQKEYSPHQLSIANKDYFKQLTQQDEHRLFISSPIKNLVTGRWTIQFNYKLIVNGEFAGVIIAAVSAEHLSNAFKTVYPAKDDVVLLTLNNGQYLARTHAQEIALDKKVPSKREFIQSPNKLSGYYNIVAPIDGIERFYAWRRIPDFPIVLSLGLGKEKVLAPTLKATQASKRQNLLGSILLTLAALWISRLIFIKAKQNRSLLQSQERFATLLNRVPSGVLLEDENNIIVTVNANLCALLNLTVSPTDLIGLHHQELLNMLQPDYVSWLPEPQLKPKQRQRNEVIDQAGRTLEIDWVPIKHRARLLGHVWFIQNITARKQKEQELLALATTDPLTGLHNRRSFLEFLQEQLKLSQAHAPGALLLLDIDHFKHVNDTYGHPAGDLVIQHTAQVIRTSLRQNDFTGRLGGEEFAALLPHTTLPQALQLAERIREHIATTPIITATDTINITISIGVALLYGHDEESVREHADQALYNAKKSGRNCVRAAQYSMDAIST